MSPEIAQDKESGRMAITELCAAFEANLPYYRSRDFDETSTRQRFIDPFFAALGWDVADEGRRGPYADVILEYALLQPERRRVAGQLSLEEAEEAEDARVEVALAATRDAGAVPVRRPDYSFRINGARQFFVEAKRPSVIVASPRPIFQVKSYAWSAGTPIAVLTDFEELLVFDCRYRPVLEEPNTGLLPEFRLSFRDFPANWDLLWGTLSRDAVASGSLARYVEEQGPRRGQLLVDRAFLGDLSRWRSQLAQSFAAENQDIDVWQLSDATQLTLDRLVFVRVCEDRRLESDEILRPLLELDEPYAAFIQAIGPLRTNYNGGLMEPDLADRLSVDSEVFKRILRGLYSPWSPYRFDVLGVEILGSIYERALGSELLLDDRRSVSIELKPEVRKAGGVYYTPQWVVEEIVRLTIDPLIDGKNPRALEEFRVLDPACGSGSFLLAALARLIRHYEDYYTQHPTVDRRLHVRDEQGVSRLTSEGKTRILHRHIYGVDVDPAAVEVTMLSLYLKSLESDSPEYVRAQMQLGGAILPSLERNIRVGNSLVSTDFYSQGRLDELSDYEEHRLRPFRWDSDREGFGSILRDGGFDVVLGNPPYFNVDASYGANHPVPAYLSQAYPAVYTDKTDIYYYFLAKAVALAKHRVGFIVSRAFLEAEKAQPLRTHLPQRAQLTELVDFNAFQVFADAGIATAIAVFDTTRPHDASTVSVRKLETARVSTAEVAGGLERSSEPFEAFVRPIRLSGTPWRFPSPAEKRLYDKIDTAGQTLTELCVLGQGMQTGANTVFSGFTRERIAELDFPEHLVKRRARNSDIAAFCISDEAPYALYLEDVARYADLPDSVKSWLELPENERKLRGRAAFQRGDCDWWRYTWPLNRRLYGGPRLISPYRTGHNRYALDPHFSYVTLTDTTVAFPRANVREDPLYLLGLLNTKLLTFRFRGLGKLTSPNMWESFDNSISELPIRRIDFGNEFERQTHDEVVRVVRDLEESITVSVSAASANERSTARRLVEALQDELEEIALDLYGITDPADRDEIIERGDRLD